MSITDRIRTMIHAFNAEDSRRTDILNLADEVETALKTADQKGYTRGLLTMEIVNKWDPAMRELAIAEAEERGAEEGVNTAIERWRIDGAESVDIEEAITAAGQKCRADRKKV